MNELHVVLGGTGGAGSDTVKELVARGKSVRATSRRPPPNADKSVEWIAVDATKKEEVVRACDGAAVVYHCVNVPYADWTRLLVPIADAVMAGCQTSGATLVVMDNLYMYGPPDGPMTEETPRRPVGPKGRLRSELEQRYLAAHRAGTIKVTIARASDFYGDTSSSSIVLLAIDPMLKGKSAQWIGSLDAPHTLSYLPDVAWGLVTLAQWHESLGQIWHIPAAEPLTGRQAITMIAEELGRPAKMSVINKPMMMLAGLFNPQIREAIEVYYQFEKPFVMDATKFTKAFGSRVTPHREAFLATIATRRARLGASP
jgi:nucleoside-diphosphate-sugar epimerase